jgi:hypothetical protein
LDVDDDVVDVEWWFTIARLLKEARLASIVVPAITLRKFRPLLNRDHNLPYDQEERGTMPMLTKDKTCNNKGTDWKVMWKNEPNSMESLGMACRKIRNRPTRWDT